MPVCHAPHSICCGLKVCNVSLILPRCSCLPVGARLLLRLLSLGSRFALRFFFFFVFSFGGLAKTLLDCFFTCRREGEREGWGEERERERERECVCVCVPCLLGTWPQRIRALGMAALFAASCPADTPYPLCQWHGTCKRVATCRSCSRCFDAQPDARTKATACVVCVVCVSLSISVCLSVSLSLFLSVSLSHSQSLSLSQSQSQSQSLILTLSHSLSLTLSLTHTHTHTLSLSVCLSVCLSVSLCLSLSLSHSLSLSLSLSLWGAALRPRHASNQPSRE